MVRGVRVAPSLDYGSLKARLIQRLFSHEYVRSLEAQKDPATAENRAAVLRAESDDERLRVWVRTQILSPGFDNPSSQMPNLGLTQREADSITAYLVPVPEDARTQERGLRGFALRIYRNLFGEPAPLAAALVGLGAGIAFATSLALLGFGVWRLTTRRASRGRSGGAA